MMQDATKDSLNLLCASVLAAKSYYFGTEGSLRHFEREAEQRANLIVASRQEVADAVGIPREIVVFRRKAAMSETTVPGVLR